MNKQNKILTALGLTSYFGNQQGGASVLLTSTVVRATALSLSCLLALPSFAQQPANCSGGYWDPGADGGNGAWICPMPIPGGSPWPPGSSNGSGPDVSGEGCSPADPDCHSHDPEEEEPDNGGNNNNPNPQLCLDLLSQRIETSCLTDPISENHINWGPDASEFRNGLPFSQWLPGSNSGHPSNQWYDNLIDKISATYWNTTNSYAVSTTFWFEAVSYCASFPFQNGNPGSISNPTYSYCMNKAYELSFAFVPELYSWNWTLNGLSRYGISIRVHSATDPLANWARAHFLKVLKIKRCAILFDEEEQEGC